MQPLASKASVVIDTNVVLDMWVYKNKDVEALKAALYRADVLWIATDVMRQELSRVLSYPHIHARLISAGLSPEEVMGSFDSLVGVVVVAPKSPYTCKDPDDQMFIDLAAAHKATLVSKDKCVLTMKNRLSRLGVSVVKVWTDELTPSSSPHISFSL
jgi:putative PIN family toxin of toxin-antitoxin system